VSAIRFTLRSQPAARSWPDFYWCRKFSGFDSPIQSRRIDWPVASKETTNRTAVQQLKVTDLHVYLTQLFGDATKCTLASKMRGTEPLIF
jgi:hypothetical protein